MLTVELDYFKPTGKWYTCGEFQVPGHMEMFQIHNNVANMRDLGKLPGLQSGLWYGVILVNVPGHRNNFPHLLMPTYTKISEVVR